MDIFSQEPVVLDLKVDTYKEIEIHQLDDCLLVFDIVNYGEPVDLTNYYLEFRCVKPTIPETYVVQNTNITKNASGRVTIDCVDAVKNVAGNVNCELSLISASFERITTFSFILIVKRSVLDGVNNADALVITALEKLNTDLSNITKVTQEAEKQNNLLSTNINNATSINTTLSTNINTATTFKTTFDSDMNTIKTNATTFKTTFDGDINTIKTNATNYKTTFNNDINTSETNATTFKNSFISSIASVSTNASTLLTNLQTQTNSSNTLLTNITNENTEAENNINILNTYKSQLPSYLELLHTNLNMIGMLWFMERSHNTRVSNVNNNMYLDSLIDDSKITLDGVTYDTTNHKVLIGDGYVQGLGYCYE
jgi:uncharacterized membrane-anchored protein YhcB (DUF1043 family)